MNWNITQIKTFTDNQGAKWATVSFVVSDGNNTIAADANIGGSTVGQIICQNASEQSCLAALKQSLGQDQVSSYEQKVADMADTAQPQVVPLPWENN